MGALDGALYLRAKELVNALDARDKELYFRVGCIEGTEDQVGPPNIAECYKAWRALGYRLSYDDTIGDKAKEALKKAESSNFHTITTLSNVLDFFDTVKVDIEWAGFLLFLCHPSYSFNKEKKAEVLIAARDNDEVKEFADWALEMI